MSKCKAPHPDNDNPGVAYRDRNFNWHMSGGRIGCCDLDEGHSGPHSLTIYEPGGLGGVHTWFDPSDGKAEWTWRPLMNLVLDMEASMQSTGTASIYKLAPWPHEKVRP